MRSVGCLCKENSKNKCTLHSPWLVKIPQRDLFLADNSSKWSCFLFLAVFPESSCSALGTSGILFVRYNENVCHTGARTQGQKPDSGNAREGEIQLYLLYCTGFLNVLYIETLCFYNSKYQRFHLSIISIIELVSLCLWKKIKK